MVSHFFTFFLFSGLYALLYYALHRLPLSGGRKRFSTGELDPLSPGRRKRVGPGLVWGGLTGFTRGVYVVVCGGRGAAWEV